MKNELKRHKNFLTSVSECLEGEDQDILDDGTREAFLKILLHFLKNRKQEKLANRLQSSKDFYKDGGEGLNKTCTFFNLY